MAELPLDIHALYQRLDALEKEIRQLRALLRSQIAATQAASPNGHLYIECKEDILSGEPCIKETRTPVRAIVEYWRFGDTPEEIVARLPHLRLAEVFDALGYYDDHRDEIENYIMLNRVPVDD
jgi:uncharacterized protein (DUF433 family)